MNDEQDNQIGLSTREKHGLPKDASLDELKPVVMQLFSEPDTFLDGVEVMLGRRVDADEKTILEALYDPSLTPEKRLERAVLIKVMEEIVGPPRKEEE